MSRNPSDNDTKEQVELRKLLFSNDDVAHVICGTIPKKIAKMKAKRSKDERRIMELIGFTKKELEDKQAELRNKEREHQDLEEKHQIEIKIYKQRLKHLVF